MTVQKCWYGPLDKATFPNAKCDDCRADESLLGFGKWESERVTGGYHTTLTGSLEGVICVSCHNRRIERLQKERERWRAAAPRCEVPQCGKRATRTLGHTVLMCGRHSSRARDGWAAKMAPYGILAWTAQPSREELIDLARAGG